MPAVRRLLPLIAAASLAVAGCGGDQAAMAGPGTTRVTADVDELRVLRHRDDPPAGDRWIDVLEADPDVFARTGSFREEGSRTAEPHEPADVRLLYEARSPGRTLLVRMDCRGCGPDGVPSTPVDETELIVWELVAGSGGELRLGDGALVEGEPTQVEVGDHVVVVRDDPSRGPGPLADDAPLRLVASRSEAPALDVFAVVAPGSGEVSAGGRTYVVRAGER